MRVPAACAAATCTAATCVAASTTQTSGAASGSGGTGATVPTRFSVSSTPLIKHLRSHVKLGEASFGEGVILWFEADAGDIEAQPAQRILPCATAAARSVPEQPEENVRGVRLCTWDARADRGSATVGVRSGSDGDRRCIGGDAGVTYAAG